MLGKIRINKITPWDRVSNIVFIAIAMYWSLIFLLAYYDQGSVYELIDNHELFIYGFFAYIYLRVFWQGTHVCKTLSIAWAIVTPVVYTLHISFYRSMLMLYNLPLETTETVTSALLKYIKVEITEHIVVYSIVFVLMLAFCLFVTIVTPKKIRHEIHQKRVARLLAKRNSMVEKVTNLPEVIDETTQRYNCLILPDNSSMAGEYRVEANVFDCKTRQDYIVFSVLENDDEVILHYYIASTKFGVSGPKLSPVTDQEVFDKIEWLVFLG